MDGNGIPINMQLFPGNTSDSKTMLPILSEVKKALPQSSALLLHNEYYVVEK